MRDSDSKLVELIALIVTITVCLTTVVNVHDYMLFLNWFAYAETVGVIHVYNAMPSLGLEFRLAYPPLGTLAIIAVLSFVSMLGVNIFTIHALSSLIIPVVKAPIAVSHYLLYRLLKRLKGYKAALLYILNPIVFSVLTMFMMDIPASLLAFASTVLLFTRPLVAGILLSTAILLKQSFILLLLVHGVALALHDRRLFLRYLAGCSVTALLSIIPFIYGAGFSTVIEAVVSFHVSRLPQGPTLWHLPLLIGFNTAFTLEVSKLWLIFFILTAIPPLIVLACWSGRPPQYIVELACLTILTAFLATCKVVNPQYMVWLLPFLAALALRERRLRVCYVLFTLASITVFTYYGVYFLGAYATHKPIFDEETRRVLSFNEVKSIIEAATPKPLLNLVKSHGILELFAPPFIHWKFTAIALTILYNSLMLVCYTLSLSQLIVEYKQSHTCS